MSFPQFNIEMDHSQKWVAILLKDGQQIIASVVGWMAVSGQIWPAILDETSRLIVVAHLVEAKHLEYRGVRHLDTREVNGMSWLRQLHAVRDVLAKLTEGGDEDVEGDDTGNGTD